jgi:anti-anti-sigma factor
MSLELTTRHVGSVYIIQCTGRIVFGDDERILDAALDHAERGFCRIVLNLSAVTRLDSMGLGLLTRHATRLAKEGGGIHLAASPSFVTTLLDLTQMSAIIRTFETEEEAILAFADGVRAQNSTRPRGPSLLIFDPSPDLCTFARTVLSQRGFNVRSTCSFGDAKLLLRVDSADYILVGPCSAQLPSEMVAHGLGAIAPNASILHLGADFKSHDALEASRRLLDLFGMTGSSQMPA